MSLADADRARIDSLIGSSDVTLFMKGNREAPQCGFSATVIKIVSCAASAPSETVIVAL